MNLLFSLDENYIPPLKTLLKSIFLNHPYESFDIYFMYSSLNEQQLEHLIEYIKFHGSHAHPVPASDFFDADSKRYITRYYTLDMYSWLFAPYILPDQDIFNALYDQDILKASWKIYNMDPKIFDKLEKIMPSKYNLSWVQKNVVFIHFNGKHKPWDERETYKYSLGRYYFAYEREKDLIDDQIIEDI